jgi:hypothetical protein
MSVTSPRDSAIDTHAFVVAIVSSLLADTTVTGGASLNGYTGTGTRIYPEINLPASETGLGEDFPYIVVNAITTAITTDYSSSYLDATFDVMTVDRAHTKTNFRGGTQNVVGIARAAFTRLVNNPLTVTGYSSVQVIPENAPRGYSNVQSGLVFRQRVSTIRVMGMKG